MAFAIPNQQFVDFMVFPALHEHGVALGSAAKNFSNHYGYLKTDLANAATDYFIPIPNYDIRDTEITVTVSYTVLTAILVAAGDWKLGKGDGDGTITGLATGTGTGTSVSTHTVTITLNSYPSGMNSLFIWIDGLQGDVGETADLRINSVRYQAKRPIQWVIE
jgi:hypothetical protein